MESDTVVLVCEVEAEAVDRVATELITSGATAVVEHDRPGGRVELRAGFPSGDSARAAVRSISSHAQAHLVEVPTHGWVAQGHGATRPVSAGRFRIRAPWHERPIEPVDSIELTIDPGSAFGHGGHPTTRLLLERLDGLVSPDMIVVDVGTGTGILAIAAAKLGARVHAIDVDIRACDVARANAERNGVDDRIVIAADLPDALDADLALVNLTLAAQRDVAPELGAASVVAASGILEHQYAELSELYRPRVATSVADRDGWLAVVLG